MLSSSLSILLLHIFSLLICNINLHNFVTVVFMPASANFRGDVSWPPLKRSRFNPTCSFQNQKKPSSIDNLPDELLCEVLRRLPGNQERSNSACVSKRWLMQLSQIRASEISQQVNNEGILSRCLGGKEVTDVRFAAAAVGTAGLGGLGKIVIKGSHPTRGLTDVGLSAIARGCPSLKVLALWGVKSVGDDGMTEIANECRFLEKLDLCECPLISDKGLVAIADKCPNLKCVTLDSCARIGDEGIGAIGRLCGKLEFVSIKGCSLVSDGGIASMMSSDLCSIRKIKLENLNIGDRALACIGYYGKELTEMHLTDLRNVGEKGFWVMGNAKGLKKLRTMVVNSCSGVTDISLEAVAKGCSSLKKLCIQKGCFVSDAGFEAFVESGRALESLQFEDSHQITLIGVLNGLRKSNGKLKSLALVKCLGIKDIVDFNLANAVIPVCKSIRSLTIRDCPGFTSSSLVAVRKICPNVVCLDLSGLVGITDAGLLTLAESSEKGLLKVSLRGCINLTDASIASLVKEHGDTLQSLNVDGCNKLTDAILLSIAEHCTQLEELDMSKTDITDYGVALLASARHLDLQVLSFSGCCKVTTRSLPLLGNMGQSLIGLNLQKCNLISNNGFNMLEEKMWWCDIIS